MSTEYRRGIPSVAHVEAATRLGLEWEESVEADRWRLEMRNGVLFSDFSEADGGFANWDRDLSRDRYSLEGYSLRPIRPDGTPVDWEVLDQEVARVGQQGQPAIVTPTAAPTQPQGFRADLWARVCRHFSLVFRSHNQVSSLTEISNIDDVGIHSPHWQWGWGTADREAPTRQNRADILTRWAVYQELKPLYDIVDGARGEVAMPEDVIVELARRSSWESYPRDPMILCRTDRLQIRERLTTWNENGESTCERQMRNFAAVLDAVAEQRVAARQGQATVEQPRLTFRNVDRLTTMAELRHVREINTTLSQALIPTDEQGNPVSWESIGTRQSAAQPTFNNMPIHATTFSNSFNQPLTYEGLEQVLRDMHAIGRASPKNPTGQPPQPAQPTPLPRFTVDELGDVDHSATTTQDSAILKRGKLPTVEAIGKYREVMAKRNSTVAEAVKVSGIDCEVAQYVLERWADGLSDREAFKLIADRYIPNCRTYLRRNIDSSIRDSLNRPTLDTSEPADTAAQRQRAEAAERKARMTALQAQLAKERAARVMEPEQELSRFALLEVDETADPARSIEAWKAQRARNVVRPAAVPAPQPALVPHRKAFEVIDAQAEGLSGTAALAVLLGRVMNGGC